MSLPRGVSIFWRIMSQKISCQAGLALLVASPRGFADCWHFFCANKKLQQALSDSHGKRHTLLDCLAVFAQGKDWYVIFLAFMYANRSHVSSSPRDGPFQLSFSLQNNHD